MQDDPVTRALRQGAHVESLTEQGPPTNCTGDAADLAIRCASDRSPSPTASGDEKPVSPRTDCGSAPRCGPLCRRHRMLYRSGMPAVGRPSSGLWTLSEVPRLGRSERSLDCGSVAGLWPGRSGQDGGHAGHLPWGHRGSPGGTWMGLGDRPSSVRRSRLLSGVN